MRSVISAWISVGMGLGYPAILVRRFFFERGICEENFRDRNKAGV
jgi:hypothetical protein